MLSAEQVLDNLGQKGFQLELSGSDIRVSPSSRLEDYDRRLIKEKKGELMTLLRARAAAQNVAPLAGPQKMILCFACRPRGYTCCPQCTLMNDPTLIHGDDGVIYKVNPEMAQKWRQSRGYPIC